MAGLVGYLGGKGNRNEHVKPRIITGSPSVQLRTGYTVRSIESPGVRRELSALLDAPYRETSRQAPIPVKDRKGNRIGTRDGHVWHCSLSLPADERVSDEAAVDLARRFIKQMKLDGCEWAAIRHDGEKSNPHVHVVVNVVKPDGRLASTHRDYGRAQAACARIAAASGLTELRGQQRHLPHVDRTHWLWPRPLTGRYKRLHDKIDAAVGQTNSPDELAEQSRSARRAVAPGQASGRTTRHQLRRGRAPRCLAQRRGRRMEGERADSRRRAHHPPERDPPRAGTRIRTAPSMGKGPRSRRRLATRTVLRATRD